ncbi:recombinase family protein [Shewanella submarina]|uniref:Recombinase family protein n=1 Tax=Shewanella submarina TaxID=2016376 RepID=A0ABV7GBE1_9GAMM|nr:recombinase family protein [Shewanella submarina]MCL1039471.1 recombinase family protein [Shewanella submarina]
MNTVEHTNQDTSSQSTSSNEQTFGYIRVSTKGQSVESQRDAIQKEYGSIKLYIDHGVSGTVPANERPELGALLKHGLRSGDTLVVWWVDRLGRDYDDVGQVMRDLLHKGVTIKTINQGMTFSYTGGTQQKMVTDMLITMLVGMAEAERVNRLASAEAGREALRANPELWSQKFQGRKADTKKHEKIIAALDSGLSIRKAAEKVGVGISTVQRVKAKAGL